MHPKLIHFLVLLYPPSNLITSPKREQKIKKKFKKCLAVEAMVYHSVHKLYLQRFIAMGHWFGWRPLASPIPSIGPSPRLLPDILLSPWVSRQRWATGKFAGSKDNNGPERRGESRRESLSHLLREHKWLWTECPAGTYGQRRPSWWAFRWEWRTYHWGMDENHTVRGKELAAYLLNCM